MKYRAGLMTMLLIGAGCVPPKPVRFYELQTPEEKVYEVEPLKLEEAEAEPDEAAVGAMEYPETLELSLEETRAWTLENNLDLKAQLISPTIRAQALRAEEAKFESTFYGAADWSKTDSPQVVSQFVEGSMNETALLSTGVEIPLQTGGTINVDLYDARRKTNQTLTDFDDIYYANDLSFSVSQPLLQGAGRRANLHSIRVARYGLRSTEAQTKLELINLLTVTDGFYWRLAAARMELEVRRQQYELAQAQLERARRLVEAGERPEVEVLRAEAGIASQLEQIILAENALRDRQRELKKLMNLAAAPVASSTRLIPVTAMDPVRYKLDPAHLVAKALENRMELLQLELEAAAKVSEIDFLHNRTLPWLGLRYRYNINALGNTRWHSFDMLEDKDFEDHAVGVELRIPLGNEAAKSRLWQAFYERMQLLATKESREDLIELEVLQAIDRVEANWQRILAARQNALLEARLTGAEIRQFEIGMRTSTDVLEAQARLADARSAEIQALAEYQVSLADLAYATGTTLGAAKVEWEPITK